MLMADDRLPHPPALTLGFTSWLADARHPRDCLRHTRSKRMPYGHRKGLCANNGTGIR